MSKQSDQTDNSESETSTSSSSSSSVESIYFSDTDSFEKKIFKKKKLPKPTLRRSSRQGMCMLTDDDSQSEEEIRKENCNCSESNLVPMGDDPVLDEFIKNYPNSK